MDPSEKTDNPHRHPWELSRSDCLLSLVRTLPAKSDKIDVADVGSGDRFFTQQLLTLTSGKITAVDIAYPKVSQQIDGIECLHDLELLEPQSIDQLIMMDVLEHVPDEDTFLKAALRKLRPEGYLILTVPALQTLFSSHDNFLKHFRRYNRSQLKKVLERNGIKLQKIHYFYGSLVAPRLLTCLKEKVNGPQSHSKEGIGNWDHRPSHILTQVIRQVLNLDFQILAAFDKIGLHPPGLSLLALGQKKP